MEIGEVPARPEGRRARQITPTDVAQFIRLDQCERYLRLRLYQRNVDGSFMRQYGVVPQSIPPLLTRSGADFERVVEWSVRQHYPVTKLDDARLPGDSTDDNETVLDIAGEVRPGSVRVLFQPRLSAQLGDWWLRGDVARCSTSWARSLPTSRCATS